MNILIITANPKPNNHTEMIANTYKKPLTVLPNLVENQLFSYKSLTENSIAGIFKEFSPIKDYSEKKFELEFITFEISAPKYDEVYAKENKLSYEPPLSRQIQCQFQSRHHVKELFLHQSNVYLLTLQHQRKHQKNALAAVQQHALCRSR